MTFGGQYYAVRDLKLTPPLEAELQPGLMVSGSSDAGRAVARTIGATAVRYPEPADEGTGKAGDDALSTGSGSASSPGRTPQRRGALPARASLRSARARSPTLSP